MIKIEGIIGLPPGNYVSSHVIEESMPIAKIYPATPSLTKGMTVFRVRRSPETYKRYLNSVGYDYDPPIKVAFLADNFPTDSFTNEYGESFLQKFTDVASQGVREVMQATGTQSLRGGLERATSLVKGMAESTGGLGGSMIEMAGKAGETAVSALKALEGRFGAAKTIGAMLAGARVDFPQLWRNSGFTPSYTMTIRLYNPRPGNKESTDRYIIGPLAVLLCLGLPVSTEGNTYNWPFFQQIEAPGIYSLNPAMITNITVVKGGDQQQISFNQALSIVDVRIDFGSLFNSILVGSKNKDRPTLYSYLQAMKNTLPSIRDHYSTAEKMVGYESVSLITNEQIAEKSQGPQLINNQSARRRPPTSRPPTIIPNRVSTEDKSIYDDLIWL